MKSDYYNAIVEEMEQFAKEENTLFIGQQCESEDFYGTLKNIDKTKRVEMPVAEEMQMGLSMGLALEGYLPISVYQRMDFLPRACDQLVNHLDLIKESSRGMYNPKIIIRTTVGTNHPFDVGLQHNKDLTEGFRVLLRNIPVYAVKTVEDVREAYKAAREKEGSIIIVEYQELYNVD
jgi:pyruvate/2-oxoglutarate/acetoin dehydrogenase E1 component